jgi:hypothetical protein
MKIAMATLNDDTYEPLAEITFHKNKREYCLRHGYEAIQKNSGWTFPKKAIGFEKLKQILEIFEEKPYLDWLHCSGCDTLVTNFNQKLEDIIDDTYHMIVCFDGNGMNVDSFLIKNSRVGKGLIKLILQVYDQYKDHFWYEQQAFIDYFFNAPLAKDIIKPLPQRVMNSYIYDLYPEWREKPQLDHTGHDGNWVHGDFMLHLPGISLEKRIEIMTEFLGKVVK